jgi:hypothetical protein
MTYLSPYPSGCSPADIDHAYPEDSSLHCDCCGWHGQEDDATMLKTVLPATIQFPQRTYWDPYCPECGAQL